MSKPYILIVDDNEDIIEALSFVLSEEGFPVKTSASGKTLLQLADSAELTELPGAIILDVLLSGYDGRELARALKKNPLTANIPLILISAHPNVSTSIDKKVVDVFLPKPFDIEELVSHIQQLMKIETA